MLGDIFVMLTRICRRHLDLRKGGERGEDTREGPDGSLHNDGYGRVQSRPWHDRHTRLR